MRGYATFDASFPMAATGAALSDSPPYRHADYAVNSLRAEPQAVILRQISWSFRNMRKRSKGGFSR